MCVPRTNRPTRKFIYRATASDPTGELHHRVLRATASLPPSFTLRGLEGPHQICRDNDDGRTAGPPAEGATVLGGGIGGLSFFTFVSLVRLNLYRQHSRLPLDRETYGSILDDIDRKYDDFDHEDVQDVLSRRCVRRCSGSQRALSTRTPTA